jgi:hypothetical protein
MESPSTPGKGGEPPSAPTSFSAGLPPNVRFQEWRRPSPPQPCPCLDKRMESLDSRKERGAAFGSLFFLRESAGQSAHSATLPGGAW